METSVDFGRDSLPAKDAGNKSGLIYDRVAARCGGYGPLVRSRLGLFAIDSPRTPWEVACDRMVRFATNGDLRDEASRAGVDRLVPARPTGVHLVVEAFRDAFGSPVLLRIRSIERRIGERIDRLHPLKRPVGGLCGAPDDCDAAFRGRLLATDDPLLAARMQFRYGFASMKPAPIAAWCSHPKVDNSAIWDRRSEQIAIFGTRLTADIIVQAAKCGATVLIDPEIGATSPLDIRHGGKSWRTVAAEEPIERRREIYHELRDRNAHLAEEFAAAAGLRSRASVCKRAVIGSAVYEERENCWFAVEKKEYSRVCDTILIVQTIAARFSGDHVAGGEIRQGARTMRFSAKLSDLSADPKRFLAAQCITGGLNHPWIGPNFDGETLLAVSMQLYPPRSVASSD